MSQLDEKYKGQVYERLRCRMMLFLAEGEPNSMLARENLHRICEEASEVEFEIQEVNVFERYQEALDHGVMVTPCVVLVEPGPRVMVAGTLGDREKVRTLLRLTKG
jgi:circadian clock protein KaiB